MHEQILQESRITWSEENRKWGNRSFGLQGDKLWLLLSMYYDSFHIKWWGSRHHTKG